MHTVIRGESRTPMTFFNLLTAAATALRRLLGVNIPLTVAGVGLTVTFGGTLIGLLVDLRAITGAPAWLKPAKFALSFALYAFTLTWLLGHVRGHPWLVRAIAGLTALGLVVEMACIGVQAARGTTSHYNEATPFDDLLWTRFVTPELTTVHQPQVSQGEIAMQLLVDRMEGREAQSRVLPPRLVVRQSTGPAARGGVHRRTP